MTALKSVRLVKTEGSSDKEYRLQIVKEGKDYAVHYQNGRRNSTLKAGLKTPNPVSLEEATKVFEKTFKEKTKDGYVQEGGSVSELAVVVKEKTAMNVNLLKEIDTEMELVKYLNDDNYVIQQKFDGERRTVDKKGTTCVGGNKKNETVAIPQVIITSLSKIEDVVLDSEQIGDIIYVFDVLRLNGEDLRAKPLFERLDILSTLKLGKNIKVSPTSRTTAEKIAFLQKMKDENAEGIVVKRLDAVYVGGRDKSTAWKFKFCKSATVKVLALNDGKRSVQMSVLDGETFTFVGNVTIPVNKDIPSVGDYIEVRYLYAYKGGSLFQPVYLVKRNDADDSDTAIDKLKYKQELQA